MVMGILGTGTCNLACWMAREPECRCQCGGKNHGIMLRGGEHPQRTCQRKGRLFRLEAVTSGWIKANDATHELAKAYNAAHGRPWWAEAAFMQHATGHILKWPEVANILAQEGDAYLVWVRAEDQQVEPAHPTPRLL